MASTNDKQKKDPEKNASNAEKQDVVVSSGSTHPTNYCETLIHLFKGNIGPGLFAMGDAFKNGGTILSPILTIAIAVISVHCQHILLNCSQKVKDASGIIECPDYAETVEKCFEMGPPKLRSWSQRMKIVVNIFICVTQLGFCCIYFVFITTNLKQILDYHGYVWSTHWIMAFAFLPVLIPSLLTKLKLLSPVSMFANVCMIFGLVVTLYFALKDGLPHISERNTFTSGPQLALYFGTAIFAFEGIALVLPLKNEMKKPRHFDRKAGVLNVGMTFVTFLFSFAGFFGYWKWGEDVGGSLTLNLNTGNWLAQAVKITVSIGVLLGYPLQFFVAIQIMWPSIKKCCKCFDKVPVLGEIIFRTSMVIVTFIIAELVPNLGLFISLIGALCSTALALVFPPLIELILRNENSKGPGIGVFVKNFGILILALLGFATGSFESISAMIRQFTL